MGGGAYGSAEVEEAKRSKDAVVLRGNVCWMQFRGKRFSLKVADLKAAELAAREIQRKDSDPSYVATGTCARPRPRAQLQRRDTDANYTPARDASVSVARPATWNGHQRAADPNYAAACETTVSDAST
jgi:hypothetical protein